jgi:serine/threonine protein kinase
MIGTFIGQYEVKQRLGEGGMGIVYLAIHRMLGTQRAVKILLPEWTRYPEIVQRFVNEALAAAAIRHRNIIGVLRGGQLPTGEWFILLDYLDGGTLSGFIESHGGPIAPHDALHILAEVAGGVQAAHDHDIVHRDLKPDNIFLSRKDGDPRFVTILDFGVAKLGEQRTGKALTTAGAIIGTPAYMAPEQMRGGKITSAVDVFALGVIAYQLVTGGLLPFQSEISVNDYFGLPITDLYGRIMSTPPIDPRRRNPALPEGWVKAIFSALDPVVGRRPASPKAFALMLAESTPGDGYAPDGLTIVRAYARELLDLGNADVTVRAPTETKASATPAQVSRYKIERKIGSGGMAEVHLGTSAGADGFVRPVAVKRVLAGFANEPKFADMFIAEARLASRLSHPNIVAVTDFDRDEEGRPFIVMEYVDGRDLSALLGTGLLPVPETIFVASEILRGLGYAHDLPQESGIRGIVHRDMSPQNVLLSWEGAVKVSDFGIAKALESSAGVRSGSLKGKASYMSPEQAGSEPLDGRSDLFAVGTMLWEMLTGLRLFDGTSKESLAKVLHAEIVPPSVAREGVPEDVSKVAMRLLERDRDRRYACAEDALDDLLACADAPRNGPGDLSTLLAARFSRPSRRKGSRPESERRAAARAASASPVPIDRTATIETRTQDGAVLEEIVERPTSDPVALPRFPVRLERTETLPKASKARLRLYAAAASMVVSVIAIALAFAARDDARGVSAAPAAKVEPKPRGAAAAPPEAPAYVSPPLPPSGLPAAAAASPPAVAAAPEAPPGLLKIDVVPWAAVWIDGKKSGFTPYHAKIAPGPHRVRIQNAKGAKTIQIMIRSSKTTVVNETLEGQP